MRSTWQARPTTYKGIQMRSRLEARFAAHLDLYSEYSWEYEPRAFASEEGQYLPDFYLPPTDGGRAVYIEVKPTIDHAFAWMARMQIIWNSDPSAELVIVTADGHCFIAVGDRYRVWRVSEWIWGS